VAQKIRRLQFHEVHLVTPADRERQSGALWRREVGARDAACGERLHGDAHV